MCENGRDISSPSPANQLFVYCRGNVSTHTEIQYATSADAYDMTYTTNYTYDVWGMCTGTTVSCENDVDTTTTEYDLNGATLSVTYNDEKVIYTYTDFGTVDKETIVKIDGNTETVRQETVRKC